LPEIEKLSVRLQALAEQSERNQGIDWYWKILQGVERYEFRKLDCLQIVLWNLGTVMKAFYPYAPEVVMEDLCGLFKDIRLVADSTGNSLMNRFEIRWHWTKQ
jgi:hypothetical protein